MDADVARQILEKLKRLEERVSALDEDLQQLREAYGNSRVQFRRILLRPPMWTFEQHAPRLLDLGSFSSAPPLPARTPSIAIVTPSYNQARFLPATIDSVLSQNYPDLFYHVQDAGSDDGSLDILKSYGDRIGWRSQQDLGQAEGINLGFESVGSDIMAYLNSDDILLPGALAVVADFFSKRPDVDIVYGHRIFIDSDGAEIGRAVLPAHSENTLLYAGYIPQETMFWRRRVWDKIGPMNPGLQYALDWEFMLRAQAAGFKFERVRRFLACFRVHDRQKTTSIYDVGRKEMSELRRKYLGHTPSQAEIARAIAPFLLRQFLFHWAHRLKLLEQ